MNNTLGKITLKENQLEACNNLHSGSILAGGVGSGKTYISIFWAAKNNNGRHIYVITEAVKRDKIEEGHTKPDWQESFDNCGIPEESYTVDSWNNIKKYEHVQNALFLFDEQRAISYNPYSKTSWGTIFVKIALKNKWILASATPGDEWIKFLPVFIANGFFKNKTAFIKEHVVFDQHAKFPKIKRYINTSVLENLRKSILVPVDVPRKTVRNRIDIMCEYDEEEYKDLEKNRFNYEKGEPYDSASEFASALRKVSNTSPDRINQAFKIMHQHKRIIVFYRFNYERDILINMAEDLGKPYAEWTGHAHQPIPEGDKWTYICQYSAASKAWSCISTNAMMFFSVSGSYNTMEQCEGRIDRLNTSYTDLMYYYMQSNSSVDRATMRSLRAGKNFNESAWIKRTTSFDFKTDSKKLLMLETKWVTKVLKPRLTELLPGCIILKNDPNMKQGIPDISIMYNGKYAVLEVKKSENATHRPNQDWYIEKFRDDFGVYANFVYPENLEEVIKDLEEYFLFGN